MKMELVASLIEEAFRDNKTFEFPIKGTSMNPFLHTGDLVELKKSDTFKKNDIILYKRNDGTFILHRIVKVKDDYFILLGDHQVKKEFPIYYNQIIGKVISYKKNNKQKYLKGIKYKIYLFSLKFYFIRKMYQKFF